MTDQIGASVARSSNVAEPIPSHKRNIIGGDPESFVPDYTTDKGSPTAGDIAEKESAAAGKANNEAAAAKAAADKEEADKKAAEAERIAGLKLADELAKVPTTVQEKEAREKLLKKVDEANAEKTAETTKKIAKKMEKMEEEAGDKK